MNTLILLFVVLAFTEAKYSAEDQWQTFKLSYGKRYKSATEEKTRFEVFKERLRQFELHNENYSKGTSSYSVSVNKFTDMTEEEFEASLSPMSPMLDGISRKTYNDTTISSVDKEGINWVQKGLVTTVKNQGRCGSCWAFAVVGAIEGQVAKKLSLVELSPQNLVDCSTRNKGCEGGNLELAYDYVKQNGVVTEKEYPYKSLQGYCQKQGGKKIDGYSVIEPTEDDILKALAIEGPISAAMDAKKLSPYSGGIFDHSSGCGSELNHAVLLVGAGSENGQKYWLIKNSWGQNWGMNGYFKLARGENACGINMYSVYPSLSAGNSIYVNVVILVVVTFCNQLI